MSTAPECPHGLVAGECAACIAIGIEPVPLEFSYHGPGPAPVRGVCRVCRGRFAASDPVYQRAIVATGGLVPFGWVHQGCRP